MRSRLRILVALAGTIALGLGSRWWDGTPAFVATHAGDALWTVALWLTVAFLRPGAPRWALTSTALIGSFLVEASQAWHVGWLDAIRGTTVGRLVLGVGWDPMDPLRYVAGALVVVVLDRVGLFGRPAAHDETLS